MLARRTREPLSTPVLTYALFKLRGMNSVHWTPFFPCYILMIVLKVHFGWFDPRPQMTRLAVLENYKGSWGFLRLQNVQWGSREFKERLFEFENHWEAQPKTGMEQEYLWDAMVFRTEFDLAVLCYWSDWYVHIHSTEEYLCRISLRVKRHIAYAWQTFISVCHSCLLTLDERSSTRISLPEYLTVQRKHVNFTLWSLKSWLTYLIFVTGTTGGACVNFFCQV